MSTRDDPVRAPREDRRRASREDRRGGSRFLAGIGVLAIVVVVGLAVIPGLLPDLNPFGSETRDRSQPTLLRSLQRLSDYRAATANLQQVVDVEEDAKLLPSFIKGKRTLLVAAGNVDASVDFRDLGSQALRVSSDRRSVTMTLPHARLSPARVDLARTRVVDRDRGLVDRAGEALGGGGADDERKLLLLAQRKLDEAAQANPDLLRSAERNTAAMLERLAEGLGYERVTVRFADPPGV